jgi:hypothetical protein
MAEVILRRGRFISLFPLIYYQAFITPVVSRKSGRVLNYKFVDQNQKIQPFNLYEFFILAVL